MRKLRRLGAQPLENQQVLEGVGQVVLPADDVGDPQVGVVHAGGQVVGRHPIRSQQRKVFHFVGQLRLLAVDAVSEVQRTGVIGVWAAGHAVAQRKQLARGGPTVALLTRKFPHAGVRQPRALRARCFTLGRVRRRKVAIRQAFFEDCVGGRTVQRQPLRLFVFLVPVEAQPAQPFEDGLHTGVGVAFHVGIVQPQHHDSIVVAGVEPVENEGAGAADVEKAGGGWGKANADSQI